MSSTAVPIRISSGERLIPPSPSVRTGLHLLWLLLLGLPVFFFQLGAWPFLDPDEGRYAEISREMLLRGDFVTPTLNNVLYFEKPPLYYWSVCLAFKLFGPNEWAARSVSALSALGTVLVVYALGRRIYGARAGLLGAVVLSTTIFWSLMARQNLIDMQLSFLLMATLALWWFGQTEEHRSRQTAYFLGFWATLALAVLSKGPVAVLLIGVAIVIYAAVCRQWAALKTMHWLPGVAVFLLIAAPWYVAIARVQPDFNHFFWYGQHIARFLGKGDNREHVHGATWFLPYLPVIFLPWSLFIPAAILAGWQQLRPGRGPKWDAAIYLLGFSLFVLLFFSASSGKLVTYILPMVPPVSLLLGAYFDRQWRRGDAAWNGALQSGALLFGAILAVGGVALLAKGPSLLQRVGSGVAPMWAYGLALVMLVWGVSLFLANRQRRMGQMLATIALGCVALLSVIYTVAPAIIQHSTCKSLLDAIRPGLDAGGTLLISGRPTLSSANFYEQRRLLVIGKPSELKFGMEHLPPAERAAWFQDDTASLRAMLSRPTPVYGLVEGAQTRHAQKTVAELGGLAILIASNRRCSMIGNRAAAAITPPQPPS